MYGDRSPLQVCQGGRIDPQHLARPRGARRLAELTWAGDQLAALAARAVEQAPAECRGYCSIITGPDPRRKSGATARTLLGPQAILASLPD